MVCKDRSIHMKQCQGETYTHCVSLVMGADQVHFAGLSPLVISIQEYISICPKEKTFSILFCLMSCCLSVTRCCYERCKFSKCPHSVLVHICRQQIASPGSSLENPWTPQGFPGKAPCGDRLHIIPFLNAGMFREKQHGKDAETRPFATPPPGQPRCDGTEMFAQARAGRNTNAGQQWAEGQTGRREKPPWHKGNKQPEMSFPADTTSQFQVAGLALGRWAAMPGHTGSNCFQGRSSARCQRISKCCPFLFFINMKWC